VLRGLWREPGFSSAPATSPAAGRSCSPDAPIRRRSGWAPSETRMLELVGRKPTAGCGRCSCSNRSAAAGAVTGSVRWRAGPDTTRNAHLRRHHRRADQGRRRSDRDQGQVAGSPEEVGEQLARFVCGGFSFLILSVSPAADGVEQRERLAREVLPSRTQGLTGCWWEHVRRSELVWDQIVGRCAGPSALPANCRRWTRVRISLNRANPSSLVPSAWSCPAPQVAVPVR
jgi:hypothetical protein